MVVGGDWPTLERFYSLALARGAGWIRHWPSLGNNPRMISSFGARKTACRTNCIKPGENALLYFAGVGVVVVVVVVVVEIELGEPLF